MENLNESDQQLFDKFRKKYQRKYTSKQELDYRFQIFLKNLRILKEEPVFDDSDGTVLLGSSFGGPQAFVSGGARPIKLYKKGINEFIDLTDEEFAEFYLLPEQILYQDFQDYN